MKIWAMEKRAPEELILPNCKLSKMTYTEVKRLEGKERLSYPYPVQLITLWYLKIEKDGVDF